MERSQQNTYDDCAPLYRIAASLCLLMLESGSGADDEREGAHLGHCRPGWIGADLDPIRQGRRPIAW